MGSTIAGVATILVLGVWYLRTRRHRNWRGNPDARFCVTLGYPLVAIAVYWLVQSSGTDWEWAVGNLWAFAAATLFVQGFNALNQSGKTSPFASREHEVLPRHRSRHGLTSR
jgi:hypothetical protein